MDTLHYLCHHTAGVPLPKESNHVMRLVAASVATVRLQFHHNLLASFGFYGRCRNYNKNGYLSFIPVTASKQDCYTVFVDLITQGAGTTDVVFTQANFVTDFVDANVETANLKPYIITL